MRVSEKNLHGEQVGTGRWVRIKELTGPRVCRLVRELAGPTNNNTTRHQPFISKRCALAQTPCNLLCCGWTAEAYLRKTRRQGFESAHQLLNHRFSFFYEAWVSFTKHGCRRPYGAIVLVYYAGTHARSLYRSGYMADEDHSAERLPCSFPVLGPFCKTKEEAHMCFLHKICS